MSTAAQPRPAARRLDAADAMLLTVGVAQLLPGLLAFLAPGAFYDAIGPYPPENDHYIKDVGTWQIALGVAALSAVRRDPAWRTPVLALLTLQYALHAISHLIDVGEPDPAWQGPFALIGLSLAAVLLAGLVVKERGRR